MSFKDELEKILDKLLYDLTTNKYNVVPTATTSIINLVDKEIIGEDTPRKLHYYDEVERENVYYADEAGSIRETENHLRAKMREKLHAKTL